MAQALRTYGRTYNEDGTYQWVQVNTDSAGYNDNVYLTTLCQVLKLNLNESPFYGNSGIPQQQTVLTQVMPDYYAMITQQQFSQYFAALTIARVPQTFPPQYNVQAILHSGAIINTTVAV